MEEILTMRISYVNGRYVNHAKALLPIEDRGTNFSDGVYEVIAFYNRIMLDEAGHIKRLERSLKEMRITLPMSMKALSLVIRELMDRNNREHGTIYLQISRGIARRDHPFPEATKPSVVGMICAIKMPTSSMIEKGISVITHDDIRWGRRDIKSISLLANVLAKQAAVESHAKEAILLDSNGVVTEGSSTNAYIVNKHDDVITHPLGPEILGGVTRDSVLKVAKKVGITIIERPFTLKELLAAKEAFITSTSINVLPVTQVDGKKISSGKPGAVTLKLLDGYLNYIEKTTGFRP